MSCVPVPVSPAMLAPFSVLVDRTAPLVNSSASFPVFLVSASKLGASASLAATTEEDSSSERDKVDYYHQKTITSLKTANVTQLMEIPSETAIGEDSLSSVDWQLGIKAGAAAGSGDP